MSDLEYLQSLLEYPALRTSTIEAIKAAIAALEEENL